MPFEIGRIIFYADEDLAQGLFFSEIGFEAIRRLGFTESEIKEFLKNKPKTSFTDILTAFEGHILPSDYAKFLFQNDKSLADFLFTRGFGEKEFVGVISWVTDKECRATENERWWSRAALSRIPGIGKNWAYGETYILERYGEDLTESAAPIAASFAKSAEKAVSRLESVLSRGQGANAALVSDDESARTGVLAMLVGRIASGSIIPNLEHKRVFLLNPNLLVENSHDKISFEQNLTNVVLQAANAGNVILAIPYFSSFIKSAAALSSDVVAILEPYITSPSLHILALDSESDYHGFLSGRETFANNFELIVADGESGEGIILMLEAEAINLEKRSHVLISYPAILAISESVERYFDLRATSEKAKEILFESVPHAISAGRRIVLKEDVLALIEDKTGIPTGAPNAAEQGELLHLEELLHKRIVGQDEAVAAVADSLKRSRAGVRNPDKPIGTFLFLGPTGVGKTETAKALADIVFSSEEKMNRLDMSEYRDAFAMERLIGSFGTGRAGALSMMLREKPYGVLLLDEFEKTTSDIVNLFLRIFDEGVFTDSDGRKINAKNNIIIATSNAGSELIWDIIKSGSRLEDKKDEVIESIIKNGIFKPELLNRFDAVVLFHPLLGADLEKVAKMMIEKFGKRMRAQGIVVEATEGAIKYLVEKGTDPKFGARPMNRAIEDGVEKLLAEKIIEGKIKAGSKISFEADSEGRLQMIVL